MSLNFQQYEQPTGSGQRTYSFTFEQMAPAHWHYCIHPTGHQEENPAPIPAKPVCPGWYMKWRLQWNLSSRDGVILRALWDQAMYDEVTQPNKRRYP